MQPQVIMEDNPPLLRFEEAVIQNKDLSIKEGRFVASRVLKVFVRGHGDTKSEVPHVAVRYKDDGEILDTPWIKNLRERHHNMQISENYLKYCERSLKQWQENHTVTIDGTPIETWSGLNKLEVERLKSINIHSIEALAEMTEDAMQAYGLGARGLKDRAKSYLSTPRDHEKAAEMLAAMEVKSKAQDEQLAVMQETIKNLQAELKKKAEKDK